MQQDITGLILAGGRARRMGGIDKGLIPLCDKPLIAHVTQRLRPQVAAVIINANRNLPEYRKWADTVVPDAVGDYDGPLAGMASGLAAANTPYILTVPCDSPLVSRELAQRMLTGITDDAADIAVATDGDRLQPVFCLLKVELHGSILEFLGAGERKIDKWFALHKFTAVDFSDQTECFININTVEERDRLEADLYAGKTA